MPTKRPALGRNLDVLLGEAPANKKTEQEQQLAIDALVPGEYQPRRNMDEQALQTLADSIAMQGIIQPIVVRERGKHYEIIAGERRWRAAQIAGLTRVPVVIRKLDDQATLAIALVENIQREDLQPLEEAKALSRLIDEFNLTHEQAGRAVGRTRVAVSNMLRLLSLPDIVQGALTRSEIEMGHARALLSLTIPAQQDCLQIIIEKGLNVRQTEKLVRDTLAAAKADAGSQPIKTSLTLEQREREKEASRALATKVTIKATNTERGKIVIDYHSDEQLQALLVKLSEQ